MRRASPPRARAFAGALVVVFTVGFTLLLTAFGSSPAASVAPAAAAPSAMLPPLGPPEPQAVAARGDLRLQLPVSQASVTAIGYHETPGALALEPLGRQGNRSLLRRLVDRLVGAPRGRLVWYQLAGRKASALEVGAAPGTDAFSPVDGTIVAIDDLVLDGRARGARIDIQPVDAPSLLVSVSRIRPDPALTVGDAVMASTSRLGTVLDLSRVERQALARYTQDGGNHVAIEVRTAPTLTLG